MNYSNLRNAPFREVGLDAHFFSFFSILYHDMVQLVIIFAPDFAAYGRRAQRSYPYY